MNVKKKLVLLRRAVAPQFAFRCSRWAPQKQIADELDRTQRKMMAAMTKTARNPGEEFADYFRRRGRIAGKLCRDQGLWSTLWFQRALRWDGHLARPRNLDSWAARLRSHHDRDWFIQRRLRFTAFEGSSVLAGKTGTRASRGKVQMRWRDGIVLAQEELNGPRCA